MSNNEIEDIIKITKSLEDSGLLLKGVTKSAENEIKEQKSGFPINDFKVLTKFSEISFLSLFSDISSG